MCEAKPGDRCAADTRGTATSTLVAYDGAYPHGPAVDPLTSSAAVWAMSPQAVAAIDQDEKHLADAARLRDEHAQTDADIQRASATAQAQSHAARASALSHAEHARAAADEALDRARALYIEAGVAPRMANYYVDDMRMSAGVGTEVAVGRYDRVPIVGESAKLQALVNAKTPAVKVKNTGPDRERTRAAATASKTDEAFLAARTRYQEAQALTTATWGQYQALSLAADPARFAAHKSSQVTEQLNGNVRAAAHTLAVTRARAAAGLNMNGTATRTGELRAADVVVNPDGTTNVWLMNEDSDEQFYERVTGVEPYAASSQQVMVTQSGRPVLKATHYANFTNQTRNPQVWVEPPAPGARPIAEIAPNLIFADYLDSGD